MGRKLTTLRSRVACSRDWASRVPLLPLFSKIHFCTRNPMLPKSGTSVFWVLRTHKGSSLSLAPACHAPPDPDHCLLDLEGKSTKGSLHPKTLWPLQPGRTAIPLAPGRRSNCSLLQLRGASSAPSSSLWSLDLGIPPQSFSPPCPPARHGRLSFLLPMKMQRNEIPL